MDTPPRAPTPEWLVERVRDIERVRGAERLVAIADRCPHPSCGAPSPLSVPPRASFGRDWSTVPTRYNNASYTAPGRATAPATQRCSHWAGVAETLDEAKALLPQGGVARARHARDAEGRVRAGVDSRWRCWRTDDGHVAQ